MLERRSALAAVYQPGRIDEGAAAPGVAMFERAARTLVQISGWPGSFDSVCRKLQALCNCPMPENGRLAVSKGTYSIFRVGPERLWIAGPQDDELLQRLDEAALGSDAVVTEIGHSRSVLRVTGEGARDLLNRGLPVDLDATVFAQDAFAQSVIDHMPVLVHRALADGYDTFDVYVTSDYAVSFWEWLTEAARSLGGEVRSRQ